MSETEGQQVTTQETGRCEKAAHKVAHSSWNQRFNESLLQMATAATIGRLAEDVAAIKEAVCDGSVTEERDRFVAGWAAALDERDKLRAEVERLKAERAARQADGNRQATLDSSPADPRPAAPPAGWLTEEEREVLSALKDMADSHLGSPRVSLVVNALLARAGSPPVVVLPTVFARSLLGDELVALQQVKDAMDKAGVKWKEV